MDNLSNVMGSKKVVTLNGKEYTVSPLTVGDWADFGEWVTQQKIDRAMSAAAKTYSNGIPADTLMIILNLSATEDEVNEAANNAGSMIQLFWMTLKKAQPSITRDNVCELVTPENTPIIVDAITGATTTDEKKAEASQ